MISNKNLLTTKFHIFLEIYNVYFGGFLNSKKDKKLFLVIILILVVLISIITISSNVNIMLLILHRWGKKQVGQT
jgi:hypothetical protein